jgi:hypothetical protein
LRWREDLNRCESGEVAGIECEQVGDAAPLHCRNESGIVGNFSTHLGRRYECRPAKSTAPTRPRVSPAFCHVFARPFRRFRGSFFLHQLRDEFFEFLLPGCWSKECGSPSSIGINTIKWLQLNCADSVCAICSSGKASELRKPCGFGSACWREQEMSPDARHYTNKSARQLLGDE